jgi:exopolysaccharide production protein ExoZ
LAALIVVLHHITAAEGFYFNFTAFGGFFKPGWNAVDFFFVLSGFIIYYIHEKDLGQKKQWRYYLSKRFIRIYPIYWLIALVSLALILVGNDSTSKASLNDISSNPYYILRSLFLIPQRNLPFLVVAWSLCYEVFFYLVFGIAIVVGKKALWVAGFCYLALFGYRLIYPDVFGNSVALSFFSSNYHIEFIFGILTAWCFMHLQKSSLAIRWIWVAGLLLFSAAWCASLFLEKDLGKFSLYSRLVFGFASAMIILGMARLPLAGRSAMTRCLLLLGDSSYVLYLIHPVLLAILFKVITHIGIHGNHPWINYTIFPVAAGCCVLAGFLLHIKVEKPMLQALNKPFQKRRSAIV